MLALERRNQIIEKLQEDKRVVVSDLSRQFGVSEETIRRDLEILDKEGIATKSYGGAVFNENNNILQLLNSLKFFLYLTNCLFFKRTLFYMSVFFTEPSSPRSFRGIEPLSFLPN